MLRRTKENSRAIKQAQAFDRRQNLRMRRLVRGNDVRAVSQYETTEAGNSKLYVSRRLADASCLDELYEELRQIDNLSQSKTRPIGLCAVSLLQTPHTRPLPVSLRRASREWIVDAITDQVPELLQPIEVATTGLAKYGTPLTPSVGIALDANALQYQRTGIIDALSVGLHDTKIVRNRHNFHLTIAKKLTPEVAVDVRSRAADAVPNMIELGPATIYIDDYCYRLD